MAAPLAVGFAGALLFVPALASGRLADDFVLLRTVQRASGVLWPFAHNDLGQPAGSSHFYRPLWVLWNAAGYQVSHDPVVAHALNIALFVVVCAEVVLLLRSFLDQRAALIGGLAFAVFPSHGESVAWISGNTDLLAVSLGLAALLVALRPAATIGRDLAAATLTAAALLAKEIAVVLPVLAAILLWSRSSTVAWRWDRRSWRPVIAMVAGAAIAVLARSFVVSGIGGYGNSSLTVKRALGSLVSFSIAGLSPPQLQVLRHPILLLVPAGLVGLIGWGTYRLWRLGERKLAVFALAGIACAIVALLPVVNEPLNLNTRNGDRLLLLPSVGLALTVGALLPRLRGRVPIVLAAVALAASAGCTLFDAFDWRTAGRESRRMLAEIDRLAPANGRLVALSVPTDYRAAHLYPDALNEAVQVSGRPDVSIATCVPVHALQLQRDQVSFRAQPGSAWTGHTTPRAPFDIPVLGGSQTHTTGGCSFTKAPGGTVGLGTALAVVVVPPIPRSGATQIIYFDGRDMRQAK